jgi:hypothetical protein
MAKRSVRLRQLIRTGILLAILPLIGSVPESGASPQHAVKKHSKLKNDQGIPYVGPNPKAYVPAATIQGWVTQFDDVSIRSHAFQIWGAITAPSGQFYSIEDSSGKTVKVQLSVFDTWFDEFEIFHAKPNCPASLPVGCPAAHHFHQVRQLATGHGGGAEVISFNKYSLEFKTFVDTNKYYDEQTLIDLNNSFIKNNTPLDQRFIGFPEASATMLKPSYFVIKRDHPTLMPYWRGPALTIAGTTDPRRPIVSTWEQFVIVDPRGTLQPNTQTEVYTKDGLKTMDLSGYPIVGLDHFYFFPLGKTDIAYIQGGNVFNLWGLKPTDVTPGDLALLVAMHVTTAEFGPWTWQTFWWRPNPVSDSGPRVKAPFTNYDTAPAYYFTDRNNKPHIAFNPYLESPIEGPIFFETGMRGSESNCMSCHHMAAFPTLNKDPSPAYMLMGSYWDHGPILGTEQFFNNRVKTRFMWGMILLDQTQNKLK